MDLQRRCRNPVDHFRRKQFCHGGFKRIVFSPVFLRCGCKGQLHGSLYFSGHIGNHPAQTLKFGYRVPKLIPAFCVFNRSFHSGPGNTDGLRSNADSAAVQTFHGDFKTVTFLPQSVFRRHAAIFENEVAGVGSAEPHFVIGVTHNKSRDSLFNDEMMIPYLQNLGVPIEDARDYSKEGCMRWIIPGKAMGQRALGGMFSLPKCLEYALNRGVNKSSGKMMGSLTQDPLTFSSIEDMIRAYLEQLRFFVEKCVSINNIVEVLDQEFLSHGS